MNSKRESKRYSTHHAQRKALPNIMIWSMIMIVKEVLSKNPLLFKKIESSRKMVVLKMEKTPL